MADVWILIAVVQVLFGLVSWAFGFRIFKAFIVLAGIAAGAVGGSVLGALGGSESAMWIWPLLGAVLGGFIAWPLHRVVVFLAGAGLGFFLAAAILVGYGGGGDAALGVAAAAALAAGIVALKFHKLFVILLTALWGGLSMTMGAFVLAGNPNVLYVILYSPSIVLIGLAIGAAGIPIQFKLAKRAEKTETATAEPSPVPEPPPPPGVPAATLVPAGNATPTAILAPGPILVSTVRMAPVPSGPALRLRRLQCPACGTVIQVAPGPSFVRCPNPSCGYGAPFPG